MHASFTRCGRSNDFAVDVEDVTHESVSVAVVRLVSTYTGDTLDELPPLSEQVDPDALDDLVELAVNDPNVVETDVTFHYHGFRITISSCGEIRFRLSDGGR